jgi:putative DNA primase/helicase
MELSAHESEQLTGFHYPAMVLPITGVRGLQGASVTFLTRDAKNVRQDGKTLRRNYGPIKGGYIQLGDIDPDRPLVVGEGIESTLAGALIGGGLPAIAAINAGNMKVLTPLPCSEVIIAADNDESGTGEAAAEALAQRLTSSGRIVRIALPQRPEGRKTWDCNDELKRALKEGGDLAALRDDMLGTEPFEGTSDVRALVRPLGMQQFMELQFPPRQFLLKPWLTTTGLVMIDAQPGHGKTWLALSVAYAVASGAPLLDWSTERRGHVLYVDGELPGELLQSRLKMLGPSLPASDLQVLSRSQFEMYAKLMPDIGTPEGREFLDHFIAENKIDLVILDSVSTLVRTGVDNDIESWRAIQDWSLTHRARGRAIIYLHHQGRSNKPRGTSGREIVLDSRISLKYDAEQTTADETAFQLVFPKAREFFGVEAEPLVTYLSTRSGTVTWRRESVKDNTRERVRELMDAGWKQTAIATELQLSRGRISQIVKEILIVREKEKGNV